MNIVIGAGIVIALVTALAYLYWPEKVGFDVKFVTAELRGDKWFIVVEGKNGFEEYEGNTLKEAFDKAYKTRIGIK